MEAQGHLRTYQEEKGPTYLFLDLDLVGREEAEREFLDALMAQGNYQVVPTRTAQGVRLRWFKAVR